MRTSKNFPSEFRVKSINTPKILNPNKGFALFLILIVLTIIVASVLGAFYYYHTVKDKEKAYFASECAKPITETQVKTQVTETEGKVSKSSLLKEMGDHTNYQLDRTQKFSTSTSTRNLNSTIQTKIIRAGNKFASSDEKSPFLQYMDVSSCKIYYFSPTGNKFIEAKENDPGSTPTIREMFDLYTPQSGLKNFPDELTFKDKEEINDNQVNVYEGIMTAPDGVPETVFIDIESGLPIKIISYNTKIKTGIIEEFVFSRINEVKETEVTLPTSAKKGTKQQFLKERETWGRINSSKN